MGGERGVCCRRRAAGAVAGWFHTMRNTLHRPTNTRALGRGAPLVLAGLFGLLVLVALLAYSGLRSGNGAGAALEPGAVQPNTAPSSAVQRGPLAPTRVGNGDAPAPSEREALSAEPAPQRGSEPTRTATLTLVGRFVQPARKGLKPAQARVILTPAQGTPRQVELRDAEQVRIEGLPALEYTLTIEAPGFVHRAQVLDLGAQAEEAREHVAQRGAELEHDVDLLLWPERWVALRVEGPDGRPYAELATELGMEPVQLFTSAFEVRARLAAPPTGTLDAPGEPDLLTFHPVHGHKRWRLPDGSAGSIELHAAPPLWIGLVVHGVPLAWEWLGPEQDELLFRIEPEQLDARLATLRLRVVAEEDGSPVPDAKLTLSAEVSAHRRAEHHDLTADAQGRFELTRIVPGSYELLLTRGESLLADAPTFAPGEVRDLGDLVLPLGRAIEIVVEREDGAPGHAFVEVAPYRPEQFVEELYPSSQHRFVPPGMTYRLSAPVRPSIVRAAGMDPVDGTRMFPSGRSANVLLDPEALPTAPLRLVVHRLRHVAFVLPEGKAAGGERVQVLDALDLIVARADVEGSRTRDVDLVPGDYRVRLVDAQGAQLDELRFEVGDEDLELLWP